MCSYISFLSIPVALVWRLLNNLWGFLRAIYSFFPSLFGFLFTCVLLGFSFLRNCRYVGNIHTQVTEPLLQEVFSSTGPVEGCKLIRKDKVVFLLGNFWLSLGFMLLLLCLETYFLVFVLKDSAKYADFLFSPPLQSSYGFIHYYDRRSAALAILSLNGRHLWVKEYIFITPSPSLIPFFALFLFRCFAGLGSLLKLTGHMLVVRGRTHQVRPSFHIFILLLLLRIIMEY